MYFDLIQPDATMMFFHKKPKNIFWLLSFIFLFSLTSCHTDKKDFVLATASKSSTYYDVGNILSQVINKESDYKIAILSNDSLNTITNCNLLKLNKVDLALAQNDTPFDVIMHDSLSANNSKLRSLFPIYSEILFIIAPDSIHTNSLDELIIGKRIGMGPENSGTAKFLKVLFSKFGISDSSYTPVFTPFGKNLLSNDSIDVSCAITGFNNARIKHMLENEHGVIFSLDNYELLHRGSTVDGFCMKYPRSEPFIIPKKIYSTQPEKPVLTVAIKSVLLTHSDIDDLDIYHLVETIFKNTQLLANHDALLGELTENFDPNKLNFPLHDGMKMYLERNKPSFFERYAELVGVLFSILVVSIGAINTFKKGLVKKKKDRIDVYYELILKIEDEIIDTNQITDLELLSNKIRKLKKKAFKLLVDEEVEANESFRIFISLSNDTLELIDKKNHTLNSSNTAS
jgi:TRAP transporter TAXI family solute receptor